MPPPASLDGCNSPTETQSLSLDKMHYQLLAEEWCSLTFPQRREWLVRTLSEHLSAHSAVTAVTVEVGPTGREYDLTAVVDTDVGRLRTPLWSHARASIYCDGSVHPANREQLSPVKAAEEAAGRLNTRLAVPYTLESRGLTFSTTPEEGVQRTWTAEHSLFRKRTAVVREDRVERAGELDVRDLLAHFYTGPSIRLVSESGEAFLLGPAADAEGPLVTLCRSCSRWAEGALASCSSCGSSAVDPVVATRHERR